MRPIPTRLYLIVLILIALASPALAELLINSGAETGTLEGWTADGSQIHATIIQNETAGNVLPQSGSYFFSWAASPGTYQELVQSATEPGLAGKTLDLTGWVQTENLANDDFGAAKLEVLDASGTVLDTSIAEPLTSASLIWEPFSLSLSAPEGADSWRLTLSGTRLFGSYINVFFDALSLTATEGVSGVPTPTLSSDVNLGNYPNPFNPSTQIAFTLPDAADVTLDIYDLRGHLVRNLISSRLVAGDHMRLWDGLDTAGRSMASGVYFYRLLTPGYHDIRKMALAR